MKACLICGGPKPTGRGRRVCDDCRPLTGKATYYQRNREKVLERTKANHRKRRAIPGERKKERERNRAHYWANPEKQREKARRWHQDNPEAGRARARVYYKKKRAEALGLTVAEADAILARGCAICGRYPGGRYIHLDHDHVNGRVRDALCHGCNTGLGAFAENLDHLRAAIAYLEHHRKEV